MNPYIEKLISWGYEIKSITINKIKTASIVCAELWESAFAFILDPGTKPSQSAMQKDPGIGIGISSREMSDLISELAIRE